MTLMKFKNRDFMPSIWDNFFGRDPWDLTNFSESTLPAVNIKETNDNFVVEVAAPGMKKDDFKIELDNNLLMISSEKQENNEEKKGDYTRREFSYQSFQRSFTLPKSVEENQISATYADGVLSIAIPKREESKAKPKRMIEIQ